VACGTEGFEFWSLYGQKSFLHSVVQTGLGAHTASYAMRTGDCFAGGIAIGSDTFPYTFMTWCLICCVQDNFTFTCVMVYQAPIYVVIVLITFYIFQIWFMPYTYFSLLFLIKAPETFPRLFAILFTCLCDPTSKVSLDTFYFSYIYIYIYIHI
jgi:hypothetical protein